MRSYLLSNNFGHSLLWDRHTQYNTYPLEVNIIKIEKVLQFPYCYHRNNAHHNIHHPRPNICITAIINQLTRIKETLKH